MLFLFTAPQGNIFTINSSTANTTGSNTSNIFSNSKTGENLFGQSKTGETLFGQSKTGENLFSKSKTGENLFSQSKTGENLFRPSGKLFESSTKPDGNILGQSNSSGFGQPSKFGMNVGSLFGGVGATGVDPAAAGDSAAVAASPFGKELIFEHN